MPEPAHSSLRARASVLATLAGIAFCFTPWASPAIALTIGIALALADLAAFQGPAKQHSRLIIQVCVVLLGFRMELRELTRHVGHGLLFAVGTIVGTFALGLIVGRVLKIAREVTLLVTSGTAICGGSAIAAVGSAIGATSAQMGVAIGTVFLLNGAALYLFPPIGHWLHLSETQFGTWAGVAIHDMSSVAGAARAYHTADPDSAVALDTANIVKLSRVVWIIPISALAAWWVRRARPEPLHAGAPKSPGFRWPIPWFIAAFLGVSAACTLFPDLMRVKEPMTDIARIGFTLALFLIGTGLTRKTLASVGVRPLVLGALLWVFISAVSLAVVMRTVV